MNDVLSQLNDAQREVVTTTDGPVLVLAGAGSGKTRALTHRIAHLIEQKIALPHEILAVTFTNKAAKEMKERVATLMGDSRFVPNSLGTFHGLGARILRESSNHHSRSKSFVILDAKDSEKLVRQALRDANLNLREWTPRSVKYKISSAKGEGADLDEVLVGVWDRYETLLRRNDAYDFDDLLRVPVGLLAEHESVREAYKKRWRWLSVDEYQDTNPLQERLLSLLTGPEKNICVVGDDYQAIYSWRGATIDHILQFEARHPGCKTIYLTQNYRSTPQILEAANQVIAPNVGQKHKTLWTEKDDGRQIGISMLPSDRHEASFVRKQIEEHVRDGGKLSDCTILYRTNAQSRLFEEEFLRYRVPYTIVGGFRFYDRREVKDALAFLYWWINPDSRLAMDRISDALFDRVGPKTLDRWEDQARERGMSLRSFVESESSSRRQLGKVAKAYITAQDKTFSHVADLLRHLLTTSGYINWLSRDVDGEERLANIEELFNVSSTYPELEQFLEDVALLSDSDTYEEQQDRVTCMTLHAAKGLEFSKVFVVGCEEGLLPHINSIDKQAAIEEERRLLYVGMTRAQNALTITYSLQRFAGGEMTPQMPSRFLGELPDVVADDDIDQGEAMEDLPMIDYELPRFDVF